MKVLFKLLLVLPLFALMACEQGDKPATSTDQAAVHANEAAPAAEHAGEAAEEAH